MRKLMLFTIGFSGFLLGYLCQIPILYIFSILIFSGILVIYYHDFRYFGRCFVHVILGVLFGVFYLWFFNLRYYSPLEPYYDNTLIVNAEVLDFPQEGMYGSYSVLVEATLPLGEKGKMLVYTHEQVADLVPGDFFTGVGLVSSAEKTFDGVEISYYTSKGILLRGKMEDELVTYHPDFFSLQHIPIYLANHLKNGVNTAFVAPYNGVILALVTGNTDELSIEFDTALSLTGLSHTVAVSGMHLAFLAGMCQMVLPKGRTWPVVVLISVMVLFMLMSGSTPSIMRATVMIIMIHVAPLLGRGRDHATSLSAAVLFILLENPYAVTHVGLHLSVASVTGLFLFGENIKEGLISFFKVGKKGLKNWILNFIFSSVATTFSAMLFTTPLLGFYFGKISLISPISNVFALWAVTISFAVGLIAGTVAIFVPLLGKLIAIPVVPVILYLQWVTGILSQVPFASVTLDSIYYVAWICFVYVHIGIYMLLKGEKRIIIPICNCICTFFLAVGLHRQSVFGTGISGYVMNAGQGQCVLFSVGENLILSDCGGNSYEDPGNLVADFIGNLGQNHLELLVISHCDTDHIGGVAQLMERIHVEMIAMPPSDPEDERQQALIALCLKNGTEICYVEEFMEISMGNENIARLYPPVGIGGTNEQGITLMLSSGEDDVLLVGDMGVKTEAMLIDRFDIPDIEVLFVGHHGSKFSTSELFLNEIQPEIGIICVGTNSYGHPTEEALTRLNEANVEVYRTDTMGTLYFQVGEGLKSG